MRVRPHPLLVTPLIGITLVIAACAPAEEQTETVAEERTSAAADVEAIEVLLQQYPETVNTGDVPAWLSYFADDAVLMPPNEAIVQGRAAINAWGQPYFDRYAMQETVSPKEIVVADEWAFALLDVTFEARPKAGGETVREDEKAIWILRRQSDGSWKVTRTIWNNNPPPKGEEMGE